MSEDEQRAEIAAKVAEVQRSQTDEIKGAFKHEIKWNFIRAIIVQVGAVCTALVAIWMFGGKFLDGVETGRAVVQLVPEMKQVRADCDAVMKTTAQHTRYIASMKQDLAGVHTSQNENSVKILHMLHHIAKDGKKDKIFTLTQ